MSACPKLCAPRILSPSHARVQASELVRAQSEKWRPFLAPANIQDLEFGPCIFRHFPASIH